MTTEHVSYCRICAAACGMVVTVEGATVVRVRGDRDHPVSRGYLCSKARGLPAWHHGPGRLDRPRLHAADATWDAVLDDLAGVLRAVIDENGPDAVAMYLATGLAYDAAGQIAAGGWLGSLGSRSFFSAATVDNAPVLVAAEMIAGNAMLNPVWDPDGDGLLLLVGTNPVVSHGYGTTLPDPVTRLRDFRRRGGSIWVIDPRRTETAALADQHIAARPGSDVAILAAVATALLDDTAAPKTCDPADIERLRSALAMFDIARAARAADVDRDLIERLAADVRRHRGKVAILCGTGTTMARDGILVEWLRWVLLILSDSLDRPGGMHFNRGVVNRPRPRRSPPRVQPGPPSRPDLPRVAGQLPAVALADEIGAGRIRVLVIAGGDPVKAIPEPHRMRSALAGLDALVVIDVLDNELCRLATHVLPATGQLERADLSLAENVSVRSGLQATSAVVDRVGDRRPVWWMFGALSQRMGGTFLEGVDLASMTDEVFLRGPLSSIGADEVFAAGPHGIDIPVEHGWVRDEMLPGGRWNVAPAALVSRLVEHVEPEDALVLTPRREMAWSNSVSYGGGRETPAVRIHPADATRMNLDNGDIVEVSSAHGSLRAAVAIDEGLRSGVVSMTHGRTDGWPGLLTSAHVDVDTITTMPRVGPARLDQTRCQAAAHRLNDYGRQA